MFFISKNYLTGIILAGGKNSRMGFNKAFIKIEGVRIIDGVYNTMSSLSKTVIISTNNTRLSYPVNNLVEDEFKDIGPLGGIHSCLKKSTTEYNLVTTCDMPFISGILFDHLLSFSEGYDATVAVFNGKTEPLQGVYKLSIINYIEDSIKRKEYSVQKLLTKLKCRRVSVESFSYLLPRYYYLNINSLEDLKRTNLTYSLEDT